MKCWVYALAPQVLTEFTLRLAGERRISMAVRPLIVRWVVRSIPHGWTHCAISRFSHCSPTGVTKTMVYIHMHGEMVHIKDTLLLIGKGSP